MLSDRVVIAGDAPLDLVLCGRKAALSQQGYEHKQVVRWMRGGVQLISDLLCAARPSLQVCAPLIEHAIGADLREGTARCILQLVFSDGTHDDGVSPVKYKLKSTTPLERRAMWYSPTTHTYDPAENTILILQDAEDGFVNNDDAISCFRKSRPDLVVYHMSRPLGSGELWDVVRFGPFGHDDEQDPMKLVVVVSADDLRADGIQLSQGLSWEKTCEDFVLNLSSNGRLDTLVTCAHLVVLFGCDGVIYHRGRETDKQTLFFDPLRGEGDFVKQHMGWIPGLTETFIAGMTTSLAQRPGDGVDQAIPIGLEALKRLVKQGLVNKGSDTMPSYQIEQVMECLKPDDSVLSITVPSEDICGGANLNWTILDLAASSPIEIAREIVRTGPLSPARHVPVAQFGRLSLYDRKEIEQFRSAYNLIEEYLAEKPTKPLNIALFGLSGSGKRFAAMEVVEAACHSRKTKRLHFNLSEFVELDDLLKAFHSIRDATLAGRLTLAYFGDFDGDFLNYPLGWLSHLSSCMQSGMFLDKGHLRSIGPAVLLFGAGRAPTFDEFEKRVVSLELSQKAAKSSEFISGLHGFIDVRGPENRDSFDDLFPVRRAVMLRAMLEEKAPSLMVGERIVIDDGVLDGLLLVSGFRHGARSLRSLLAMSKLNQRSIFDRTALPSSTQLRLHVDYDEFMRCVNCQNLPSDLREVLAEKLHNIYRQYRLRMARSGAEKLKIKREISLMEWNALREDMRESARAHADDIPRKLRLLSCFLAKSRGDRTPVTWFSDDEVKLLGEQEHERWNAERFQGRWRFGARDQVQRTSPFLVPWRDLDPVWSELDCELVRSYPSILPDSHCIYRSKTTS